METYVPATGSLCGGGSITATRRSLSSLPLPVDKVVGTPDWDTAGNGSGTVHDKVQ